MSLSSYFFRKILRSEISFLCVCEISFNWVPPSENAQTWKRPLGSASHQWQTCAGPCVSFRPCHCEPLSFALCKLDITMGNLRPYTIDPYLCGPYSSSPSPTQPKKKLSKTFLMLPSQWTELEALFLRMMGAKKLLRSRLSVRPAARTESCLPETHLHWPWPPCPQKLIEREQEDSITHCSAYNKQGPTLVTEPTSVYICVCVLTSTYTDVMYT